MSQHVTKYETKNGKTRRVKKNGAQDKPGANNNSNTSATTAK